MPVHDWTRVDAGIFHHFHLEWVTELCNTLNRGLLPREYYALTEQHAGRRIADVLTLHAAIGADESAPTGGVAVAEAPPKVRRRFTASVTPESRRRTVTIRHVSGDRIVALVELVSPANKDRSEHVIQFCAKVEEALRSNIHVLVVDLFPPGPHDPQGMHGAIWQLVEEEGQPYESPVGEPLTLASYVAIWPVDAYVEPSTVGGRLPDMPLFLLPERYVNVPLEATYQAAFRNVPEHWRRVLEAPAT